MTGKDGIRFDPRMVVRSEGRLAEAVSALAWSCDGAALAACSLDGEVAVVGDAAAGGHRLDAGASVGVCAWSAGGTLAVGGDDGALWLWGPPEEPARLEVGLGVEDLAWRDDELAVAAGDTVVVLDEGGASRADHPMPSGGALALAWRAGPVAGRLVVGGLGGARELSRPPRLGRAWPLATVLSLAVEPVSGLVAAGTLGGDVEIIDGGPAGPVRLGVGRDAVECVSWGCDGLALAALADGRLRVWRRPSPQDGFGAPLDLHGHDDWVVWAGYSPAGPLLASVGLDGRVAVWDPGATADPIERAPLAGELAVLAWRPDGRMLGVGGPSGGYWLVDVSELAALAGRGVGS